MALTSFLPPWPRIDPCPAARVRRRTEQYIRSLWARESCYGYFETLVKGRGRIYCERSVSR
jgi:hypothetical protein